MDETLWVIIYSQYSDSCKRLMTLIDQASLDIQFQVLCIDDANLRKRIANDKKFRIKVVPCILRVEKDSGIASQYEGKKSFELIYSAIDRQNEVNMHHQQPQAQVLQQPQTQVHLHQQAQQVHLHQPQESIDQHTTPIEAVLSEDEEDINGIESKTSVDLGDRPMGQRRNTNKVSVNTIMASREEAIEIETKNANAKPEMDIKPVKTGKKVSVAEIMANKN